MSIFTRRSITPELESPAYIDDTRIYIPIPKSEFSEFTQNQSQSRNHDRRSTRKLTYAEQLYLGSKYKQILGRFIDSNPVMVFTTILTIYTLFADDIRNLATSKRADDIWFGFASICLSCFILELFVSCAVKKGYLWSFYFWLDLISTISLIPDIGWIWNPMVGVEDTSSGGDSTKIHNVGKAARAGTRTSRVIRIIRLIRLIRILKLYKTAQQAIKAKDAEESLNSADYKLPEESKVGKKLTELTIKRVIILVLVLLMILPLFDTEFYLEPTHSWDFGIKELNRFYNLSGFDQVRQEYITYHEDSNYPLIYLSYKDRKSNTFKWESDTDPDYLRFNEKHYADSDHDFIAIFDLRYETEMSAILNIFRTLFVCFVLSLGAVYFTKDSTDLIITPIEKMMNKVQRIAKNPMLVSEVKLNDIYDLVSSKQSSKCASCLFRKDTENVSEYETTVLEDTIIKIGVLLALCFGEAGSSIITISMQKTGDLDFMLHGTRCIAVFGFCDIRNFTDTTEVLLEGVMLFVNEIAEIVHGIVDKYQGATNKNIGDAFLLVWKFDENDLEFIEEELEIRKDSIKAKYIADCALFSFVKIIARINTSSTMLRYRSHGKLNNRMPGYQVKMGFGLHLGWAIEGAIGSEYKIDASYLSPNVNLASRLEAATKQFGVPILLSGIMYESLSSLVKNYCRHIDTVTVKGSEKPIKLYTIDLDSTTLLPKTARRQTRRSTSNIPRRVMSKKDLRILLRKGSMESYLLFENSKEFLKMRLSIPSDFFSIFDKGLQAYISGDWKQAKDHIENALIVKPKDGPSETLIEVMRSENFQAPVDWKGYRALTEK